MAGESSDRMADLTYRMMAWTFRVADWLFPQQARLAGFGLQPGSISRMSPQDIHASMAIAFAQWPSPRAVSGESYSTIHATVPLRKVQRIGEIAEFFMGMEVTLAEVLGSRPATGAGELLAVNPGGGSVV